jgi:peptide/nickel transport system substrate-binding protein
VVGASRAKGKGRRPEEIVKRAFVVLQLSLALALFACAPAAVPNPPSTGGTDQRPAASAPQRTLVIAYRQELPSVAAKPLVSFSAALNPALFLFNAAIDYADEQGNPHPYLVEALPQLNTDTWRVLPDGRMETTYKLKPNLTWHDGTPLSAEDFVFAWRVYATPALGAATSPPIGLMEEVAAPDAGTIVIRWKQPYPDAVALTDGTRVGFAPLPRHILQQPFQELDSTAFAALPYWTTEYVGLGPYRIEQWEPGAYIAARAFDGYVLGRPKIDRIELRFIPDPQTAVANLLSNEVQYVGDFILSVTEGETLEREFPQRGGGVVLYSPVSLRSSVVQMRPDAVENPALLDVRVRRAIASGIDSPTAVEVLTSGKGIPTGTLTSPRVPFYAEIDRVIRKYPYDARQAQQLMEEAGYTKGSDGFFASRDGQPVRFSVATSAGVKNESEAATYVDSLRRAGFDVTQRVLPAAQIGDPEQRALLPGLQIRGGGVEHVNYTSEQIPRPTNRWRGENRGGWNSPEYDRIFAAYTSTLGESERIGHLAQLERLLTEELPVIPHYFGAEANAHVATLQGPLARQTPSTSGTFLNVHQWQWRS